MDTLPPKPFKSTIQANHRITKHPHPLNCDHLYQP